MVLTIKEEIEKRCNEDPEFKNAWEEKKRLNDEFEKAAKPKVKWFASLPFLEILKVLRSNDRKIIRRS